MTALTLWSCSLFIDIKDHPSCGNSIIDKDEECDNENLNEQTCENSGFTGGIISCNLDCSFNFDNCHFCGDNLLNGDEKCDGSQFSDNVCHNLGYFSGVPSICSSDCMDVDLGCKNVVQWGTSHDEYGIGITIDSTNNIYITGHTFGDLDGNVNVGDGDVYLTKYDVLGVKKWSKQWGTSDFDKGKGVVTDNKGNIYVCGYTAGTMDSTSFGNYDIFLSKYDGSGEIVWTKQWGTINADYGNGLAYDSSAVYVVGHSWGDLDGNIRAGEADIFLTKFNISGEKEWTKLWGTSNYDKATKIIVNSTGIFIVGFTEGDLQGNINLGLSDIFLTKLDLNGVPEWTKQWGSELDDYSPAIAIDSENNIYVTGSTDGEIDSNISSGDRDIFLTKFNSSGIKEWTKQWGTSSYDKGYDISIDFADNIYVTGYTWGDLDGNLNAGERDIFLTKFNSSGIKEWTKQWGTSDIDKAYGIDIDSMDNIYITGYTAGDFQENISSGGDDIFLLRVLTDN